jgi:hypothetical protein
MAGGDLLFIVSFIILPTAIVVSCVWALILIKKGVLLPDRRLPVEAAPEDSEAETSLVEETGEHVAVTETVPTSEMTLEIAGVTATGAAHGEHAVAQDDGAPGVADAGAVIDADEGPRVDGQGTDELTLPDWMELPEPDEAGEVPPRSDDVIVAVRAARALTPAPEQVPNGDAAGSPVLDGAPAEAQATPVIVPLEDVPAPGANAVTPPRRPARRVAQLRPTDEPAGRPRPRAGQRRTARRPGPESVGEGKDAVEGGHGPADLISRDDE